MSIDIRLKKVDRIYFPGQMVSGVIVMNTKSKMQHSGIKLTIEGMVNMQLSAKSVGLFEAFYNSVKPIQLMQATADISKGGKFEEGTTEIPFEFKLEPMAGQTQLFETYHGVFVNIQYQLKVDMQRPLLAKNLQKTLEFLVEMPKKAEAIKPAPLPITITPESLENVKKTNLTKIPKFKVTGRFDSAACNINKPITGEVIVEECAAVIKSIEIQLVRVETCGSADGYAKESTEIQNIQIAEGDVIRGTPIPVFMVFPRLFTCPTTTAKTFKIEFEINLVIY